MLFSKDLAPVVSAARIVQKCIARHVLEHFGELEPVSAGQEERKDFSSADHGYSFLASEADCFGHVAGNFDSFRTPMWITRQHDVTAAWKHTRKAFKRLASHH